MAVAVAVAAVAAVEQEQEPEPELELEPYLLSMPNRYTHPSHHHRLPNQAPTRSGQTRHHGTIERVERERERREEKNGMVV